MIVLLAMQVAPNPVVSRCSAVGWFQMEDDGEVASKAASIAVITVLRSSVVLCVWGAFLACLSPDFCFYAFKFFSTVFSDSTRTTVVVFWRAIGALVAALCTVLLGASGTLTSAVTGSLDTHAEELKCAHLLKLHFQDSRKVGVLASVLVVLYAEQIWNRCLCAFSHRPMPRLLGRAFHATKVWSLWILLSRPSLLAITLALHMTVNWFLRDMSSLLRGRNNALAVCIYLVGVSVCSNTAYTSYIQNHSKCETGLGFALVFWIGILDALDWVRIWTTM